MSEQQSLVVNVDFSKSKPSDWILIADLSKGLKPDTIDFKVWLEFLDRVVVGGMDQYPMTALWTVINIVTRKLAEQSNPKAPAA